MGLGCVWQSLGGERGAGAGGQWHGRNLGHAKAAVELLEDGRVQVLVGAVEKGQDITTILAQMAAESLGMPMESLVMILGDTFLAPWGRAIIHAQANRSDDLNWFLNGRLLQRRQAGRLPLAPGTYELRCVTSDGQSSAVRFHVR